MAKFDKKTKEAQDKLIKFMLGPQRREIAKMLWERRAEKREAKIFWAQIDADIEAGICIADRAHPCECKECREHSEVADAAHFRSPNISVFDAIISAGFSKEIAEKHIAIFDDLGIFTFSELYGHNP